MNPQAVLLFTFTFLQLVSGKVVFPIIQKALVPSNLQNVHPSIRFENGTFYTFPNRSVANFNYIHAKTYHASEMTREDCSDWKARNPKFQNYFFLNLGQINQTWNIILKNQFFQKIDESMKCSGLLGYVIEDGNYPVDFNNLSFLKIVNKDLRRHLKLTHGDRHPVGLMFKDESLRDETKWVRYYFGENSSHPVQFYRFGQDENRIETPLSLNGRQIMLASRPFNYTKHFPQLVEDGSILKGINLQHIPHSPRNERCFCLSSTLKCYTNYGIIPVDPIGELGQSAMDKLCNYVDCKTIKNNPHTGIYGILAGCTDTQRLDLVFNWYCSVQSQFGLELDSFDGLLRMRNQTSGQDILGGYVYPGNYHEKAAGNCSSLLLGNWSLYIDGKLRVNDTRNVSCELDIDDELDAGFTTLNNHALQNSIVPTNYLILGQLLLVSFYLLL
ncbi:unnamed protein product [Ambrosiozyma monospora]|uniref:Unnamed protein product n=1 Tax=Ambrosiozyma monospora TaxID=43982 RepID=A0ACB5SS89_AMBMO|nr:unnamed protein product [Ambrosiozyma monospora]